LDFNEAMRMMALADHFTTEELAAELRRRDLFVSTFDRPTLKPYAEVLRQSGAIVIERDENGEWPESLRQKLKSAIGATFVEEMGWGESHPLAALEVYAIAEKQAEAILDALAAAQEKQE
jgi:hypothetical protein